MWIECAALYHTILTRASHYHIQTEMIYGTNLVCIQAFVCPASHKAKNEAVREPGNATSCN